MFTGIIEQLGKVVDRKSIGNNVQLCICCDFKDELKIDQSVAHNGVCLTVTDISSDGYFVDVIPETLSKSNLGKLKLGDKINLERSLRLNDRIDGHMVQGHVDQTAELSAIIEDKESWTFKFNKIRAEHLDLMVDKGSVAINGVSLTISKILEDGFEVSIIPYTFNNTNFCDLVPGNTVNIEFDVLGKYVKRILKN